MNFIILVLMAFKLNFSETIQVKSDNLNNDNLLSLQTPTPNGIYLAPSENIDCRKLMEGNSLLTALLLSTSIGLHPIKDPGNNHPEHHSLNPYLALLLSHYGKYTPIYGTGRGLYGYNAVNNYHNNKPFGTYKVYDDNDS